MRTEGEITGCFFFLFCNTYYSLQSKDWLHLCIFTNSEQRIQLLLGAFSAPFFPSVPSHYDLS